MMNEGNVFVCIKKQDYWRQLTGHLKSCSGKQFKMADVLATASKQPRLPQVQERPFPIMKIAGKS
ncbi:MAG: hypothetical protein M5U34_23440 [Chloroflexi bacterium]|nr:hypothetical protein [Chloroflexota bacterium]